MTVYCRRCCCGYGRWGGGGGGEAEIGGGSGEGEEREKGNVIGAELGGGYEGGGGYGVGKGGTGGEREVRGNKSIRVSGRGGTNFTHSRRPLTLASMQCRDGARRVFTDQAGIACTKREESAMSSTSRMKGGLLPAKNHLWGGLPYLARTFLDIV